MVPKRVNVANAAEAQETQELKAAPGLGAFAVSDSTRAVGQTGTRPADETTAFQRLRFPAFPLLSGPCGHVTSLFVERTC